MGKSDYLGEFEQVVLLAIMSLEDKAYGVEIRRVIKKVAGRSVTAPTVYTVLQRLEQKGLLASRLGEATPERGGRAKRYYRLLPKGVRALDRSKKIIERMWASATADHPQ